MYHRGARVLADTICRAFDTQSLPARHKRDDEGEKRRLDHTHNKVPDVRVFLKPRKEHARADTQLNPTHEGTADERRDICDQAQHRQHEYQRNHARQDQHFDRIKADGADRIDLFVHLHGTDGRGVSRSGPTRDDDRSEQYAKFAQYRNGDEVHDKDFGSELSQLRGPLIGQHNANQESHQRDDRNRIVARLLHLGEKSGATQAARTEECADKPGHHEPHETEKRPEGFCAFGGLVAKPRNAVRKAWPTQRHTGSREADSFDFFDQSCLRRCRARNFDGLALLFHAPLQGGDQRGASRIQSIKA